MAATFYSAGAPRMKKYKESLQERVAQMVCWSFAFSVQCEAALFLKVPRGWQSTSGLKPTVQYNLHLDQLLTSIFYSN